MGGRERGRQRELVLVVHRQVVVKLREVAAPRRGGGGASSQLCWGNLRQEERVDNLVL